MQTSVHDVPSFRLPPLIVWTVLVLLCAVGHPPAADAQPPVAVRVHVVDAQRLSVPGATCVLRPVNEPAAQPLSVPTNGDGTAEFSVAPGSYDLRVELDGFQPFVRALIAAPDMPVVEAMLQPALAESVTVAAPRPAGTTVQSGAAPAVAHMKGSMLKRLPIDLAKVQDALPLVPGVIRSPTGEINIQGASEEQSAFLVNGLSAADPATGGFRLTMPVDAVEAVQVFMHPYTAEYGQFTGGLTQVETRSGGSTWHAEVNDFLPDLRFVNGRVVGIQSDEPHLNVNGPILKDRLFLSQSASYTIAKQPVRGLDFPHNETKTEAESSFTQLDATFSSRHSETLTVGYFPASHRYVGLDVFRPQPVTPDARQRDLVATLRDNTQAHGALFSTAIALNRFDTRVWGQGSAPLALTPLGEQGNYFATQDRRASRLELIEVVTLPTVHGLGQHDLKFGFDTKTKWESLLYAANPVEIVRADGSLARRITFERAPRIASSNHEYVGFAQDRWRMRPDLTLDLGVRYEDQRIADAIVLAPRAGIAWTPDGGDTVIRGGAGLFYGNVPLNLRAFAQYPARTVAHYAADGTLLSTVRLPNVLVSADTRGIPATSTNAEDQLAFVPSSFTWNVQVDRIVGSWLTLRANMTSSTTSNVYTVDREADAEHQGYLVLRSNGSAAYRSLELTGRVGPAARAITLSYTRSRSMADLNDFSTVFGDFAAPLVFPNQYAMTPSDVPHRFLAWGAIPLPHRMSVAPIFELRSGFPYTIVNQDQSVVGTRNGSRFPTFMALDMEVSKDLHLTGKYDVRLSLRAFNVTNHFNPRDVRANTGDPGFGSFLAPYRRYFTGGFDILF